MCDFWCNVQNDNIIRRMRIACWMAKTTVTYSQYLIFNSCTVQQWFHECAWLLFLSTVPVWLRNVTGLLNILQHTGTWLIVASTSCMKRISNK
jgi:hypothetical protein